MPRVQADRSCVDCGRPRGRYGDRVRCRPCRRRLWRESGYCVDCGSPRDPDGTVSRCQACREKTNSLAYRRHNDLQKRARCISCQARRGKGGTKWHCAKCVEVFNAAEKLRRPSAREDVQHLRDRRQKAGRCIDCGSPRGPDGTKHRCRPCQDAQNDARRARRRENQDALQAAEPAGFPGA